MRSFTILTLALALALPSVLSACPGADARTPYGSQKVALALSREGGQLVVDATVSGCPGQVMLHQQALARVIEAARGSAVTDGAFAISGLEYELTATGTGTTLRVSGPADVLEAFQAVLEDEQAEKLTRPWRRPPTCGTACHPEGGGSIFFDAPAEDHGATRL